MRVGRQGTGIVEELPGRIWVRLLDSELRTRSIRIGLAAYPPGGAAPASVHDDEDEILIPVKGRATLVGGAEEILVPGDVAWVPAGERHAIRADSDVGLEVVAIFFSPDARSGGE